MKGNVLSALDRKGHHSQDSYLQVRETQTETGICCITESHATQPQGEVGMQVTL